MSEARRKAAEVFRRLIERKIDGGGASSDDELLDLPLADLNFDSLEKMELVMELENAFDLPLDEEDLLECTRLNDILRLIERSA